MENFIHGLFLVLISVLLILGTIKIYNIDSKLARLTSDIRTLEYVRKDCSNVCQGYPKDHSLRKQGRVTGGERKDAPLRSYSFEIPWDSVDSGDS